MPNLVCFNWALAGGFSLTGRRAVEEAPRPSKQKISKGTKLHASVAINDQHRRVERVWLSPHGNMAVCADNYGRVLLFDALSCCVVLCSAV